MQRTISAVAILTLLAAGLAGAATKYVIKDLGVLPRSDSASAQAINSKGQIIGNCWKASDDPMKGVSSFRPFFWEAGHISAIKAPLGPDGVAFSDINDSGAIMVSNAEDSFIVDKGKATKIKIPEEFERFCGLRLNAQGDVLGECRHTSGDNVLHIYRGGVMQPVEAPDGYSILGWGALNNKGQIACDVMDSDAKSHIALLDNGKASFLKGVPESFYLLGLADDGAMIGTYEVGDQEAACVWRDGKVMRLRALPGTTGPYPMCINNKGAVAGLCSVNGPIAHAVVWNERGVPTELPALADGDSRAFDINDAGQIVGQSDDENGKTHAVLWEPVK